MKTIPQHLITSFARKRWIAIFLLITATSSVAFSKDWERSYFTDWRTQTNGLTAGWFGLAEPLKSYGFSATGEYKQQYFGQVSGGLPNQPASNWAGEVKMKFLYDFATIFGIKGLTLESNWRERFGGNPQFKAGTFNTFNPSQIPSGPGLRILTQQFEYTTANKALTINAGWENPYEQFLQQPLSKLFENNAITSAKGIGAAAGPGIPVFSNATGKYVNYASSPVPWGSTYTAWGGTLKVRPIKQAYIQSGLYAAISGTGGVNGSVYGPTDVYPYTSVPSSYLGQGKAAGQSYYQTVGANGVPNGKWAQTKYVAPYQNNHGFNFQGSGSFNPNGWGGNYSQNGLYNVNEIGWEPKFGKDQYEGKYAVGSYIWGQNNTSYTPVTYVPGQTKPTAFNQNSYIWGLYFQADQQIFKEKSDDPAKPSKQGLATFNELTFTDPHNNALPLYFHTGLVYRGLIPKRDDDSVGIVLGEGFYSSYYNQYINQQNNQVLINNYGSPKNGIAPNGPVNIPANYYATGLPSKATTYYQYAPQFSATAVIEAFYNVQLTKWASIKPGVQYISNPSGNGTVANAWILGATAKVAF